MSKEYYFGRAKSALSDARDDLGRMSKAIGEIEGVISDSIYAIHRSEPANEHLLKRIGETAKAIDRLSGSIDPVDKLMHAKLKSYSDDLKAFVNSQVPNEAQSQSL